MPTTPDPDPQLGGRKLKRVVYSEAEIRGRVEALARDISAAYVGSQELLVLGLLKGSFIFLADLVRRIERPLQVDFLVASSYGAGKVSSGEVRLLYDPEADLAGRAVLVVEDIIDSGTTLGRLMPLLEGRGPRSLELCALLHKRRVRLEREPRWVGFDAPSEFLVGYGLDYSEDLRHLPYSASL
jgi:hypoxanthine phosphoribosyltransferase